MKNTSYGQNYSLTLVDKFGVYLSNRKILEIAKKMRPKKVVDLGCGFHARLLQNLKEYSSELIAVDVALDRKIKGITLVEKQLDKDLDFLDTSSVDLLIMNSVLEHLENPEKILVEVCKVLCKGGVLVLNVPTWFGKKLLEFSAFELHLSPVAEINDHKRYYDLKDIWPLLVRAGFEPRKIKTKYHKFGLNLMAFVEK